MEMTSPQGEVLMIPTEGVRSMLALGWVATTPPEVKKKPAPRKKAAVPTSK